MATVDLPASTYEHAQQHARRAGVDVATVIAEAVQLHTRKSFVQATLDDDWQQLHPACFQA